MRTRSRAQPAVAPDVYVGVGALTGPDANVVERLVMMKRMPENRRLSSLIGSGVNVDAELRDVARHLASFHTRAERSEQISSDVTASSLEALWQTSFTEVAAHPDLVPPPRPISNRSFTPTSRVEASCSMHD